MNTLHESINQLKNHIDIDYKIMQLRFKNDKDREPPVFVDCSYDNYQKYIIDLIIANQNNYNIYILLQMINDNYFYVMLDDLTTDNLNRLIDNKYVLYFIETSPANYQAILKFETENIIEKDEYLAINRYFVKEYKSDKGSIGTAHFFRVAGFYNQKFKYIKNNIKHSITYNNVGNTINYIDFYDKNKDNLIQKNNIINNINIKNIDDSIETEADKVLKTFFFTQLRNFKSYSEADFKAIYILRRKGFSQEEAARSLLKCSPGIFERKKYHLSDYINRTISKIYNS
jgi:hypothetical protein